MSSFATARIQPPEPGDQAARGNPVRLAALPAPAEQRILAVAFRSPDGRRWSAIGGGATLDDAIGFAHESCPDDTTWAAVAWDDLYGE